MKRRSVLGWLSVTALGAAGATAGLANAAEEAKKGAAVMAAPGTGSVEKVVKTEAEWKKQLSPQEFHVLREEGTERAFTGKFHDDHDAKAVYVCAGCGLELFAGEHKFDSGTGWPSFYQPIKPESVETKTDKSFFSVRVEVHCARCGGHMGHVFEDGPKPTGLRYCINGTSLNKK